MRRRRFTQQGEAQMKKMLLVFAMLFVAKTAYGQEQYVELLKSDIKTQKIAVITEAMALEEGQSEPFWKIYRDYDYELSAIVDQRIALIKDYAASFSGMTDEKAAELAKNSFKIESERADLRQKYYKQFAKDLSPLVGARWLMIERTINTLMDLQIAAEMPLIQEGGLVSSRLFIANATLAGRSARRRMYHGNQKAPKLMRTRTR